MISLEQKIAIVTGAAHPKGMGFAAARHLARSGASVILTDLPKGGPDPMEDLERAAAAIKKDGGQCLACIVDVTKRDDIDACVALAKEHYGGVDILFNNAGVGVGSNEFLELSDRDWHLNYSVNVKGPADFCQAIIPSMIERGGGAIVNNASVAGLGAHPGIPAAYTAMKHAIIGLTKAIALEFGAKGIRCNAICPGAIKTQMQKQAIEHIAREFGISEEEAERMDVELAALKRAAEPEEVAEVVAFLASPMASFVSGVAIPVSGGMSAGL